jgi:uncharacterized protein GlcG (DUF336 family)
VNLSLGAAEEVVAAARKKAVELGVPMNIAVVDCGGHLKAFVRMDGAVLGSIEIAQKKARTAVLFGVPSEALFEYAKPGGSSFGLEQTNGGLVVFAGGIPLRSAQGELVGAVGVSGGAVPQDFEVAEAGAAAVRERKET